MQNIFQRIILLIFILTNAFRLSVALRCYACSVTSQSSNLQCLNDPASAEGQSVVNCNKKYCTIFRQELKDPPGKLNSLVRGCEEKPIFLDEVLDDAIYRTHYRSCTTDLCNDGDGTKTSSQENVLSPDSYTGENLLVPGLPWNKATEIHINMILLFVMLLCVVGNLF